MLKIFLFLTLMLLTPFENAEACAEHAAANAQERAVASEEKPATKEEAAPKADEEEVKPAKFPQTYPRPH